MPHLVLGSFQVLLPVWPSLLQNVWHVLHGHPISLNRCTRGELHLRAERLTLYCRIYH